MSGKLDAFISIGVDVRSGNLKIARLGMRSLRRLRATLLHKLKGQKSRQHAMQSDSWPQQHAVQSGCGAAFVSRQKAPGLLLVRKHRRPSFQESSRKSA
jgi:hypothetical protein